MAEWVLKGSLKGPQGEAGADAQLPEGGTTGDFLQKKADGTGWFNSEGLLRASYVGTLQQLGDEGQSLEIHDVSVTSNGYVAGVSTDKPTEDGAFVYADDKNSSHLGHNRVGVLNGIPYVDLKTSDITGSNPHLADDGHYVYVDDIEAAGEDPAIPTGAAVKQYVADHAGDALPSGGTDGQVLTSDGAGGAAWESVPQPDLTGVVDTESVTVDFDGESLTADSLKKRASDGNEQINLLNVAKTIEFSSGDIQAQIVNNTNVGTFELSSIRPGAAATGISSEYSAITNEGVIQSGAISATASPMGSRIVVEDEGNGSATSFIAGSGFVIVDSTGTNNSGSKAGIYTFDTSARIEAATYGDTGTQQARIELEVQGNTAYIGMSNDGEPTRRYTISDTISSTKDTFATGKAVAAYLSENSLNVDTDGKLTNAGANVKKIILSNGGSGSGRQEIGLKIDGGPKIVTCVGGNNFEYSISDTITDDYSHIPTGGAVVDYVAANAPETDLSGLLKADFTGIEKLDANTVDISTLGPGTYLLSAVAQGSEEYNDTLFPDEMVYGNPDSGTCILNVYGGFSGTGRKHLELFVIKSAGSGSRYYATTDGTGTLLSKDSWQTDKINLNNAVTEDNTNSAVTGKAVADYVASKAADPDELVEYINSYGGGA